MTLDELRAAILAAARRWIAWGGSLERFLDDGRLPESCIAHGETGPRRPSIDLNRRKAGGHRTRILGRPDDGEIVLTWAQVRRALREAE